MALAQDLVLRQASGLGSDKVHLDLPAMGTAWASGTVHLGPLAMGKVWAWASGYAKQLLQSSDVIHLECRQ